jgi:hypothetical protein
MSLAALAVAGLLMGCQQGSPTKPTPAAPADGGIKPFAVRTNDGIDHEFYRDVSLDAFLKQLPSGSVDSLDLDLGGGPRVFALVKVPEQPGVDLTTVRFETTFRTQDGQAIDKHWAAAKDRKVGKAVGVFCLPLSVVGGETRIVRPGAP